MMTIRTKEAHKKEIQKAIKFAKKIGLTVDIHPRHTPGFTVVPGHAIKVITPIWFEIGEDKLLDMYYQIKTLGISGRICLKGLIKSFGDLTRSQGDDIRNCCWVSSYTATDFLSYFYSWIVSSIEKQRISISTNISKATTRNLWYSLGGYRGIRTFCADAFEATLTEFRRIRTLEEKAEKASIISIENPVLKDIDAITEYNPCLTCKNCKIDAYGCRVCKRYLIEIPEDITVREVNKMYPSAAIIDCGKLHSKFIMRNPGTCQYYRERIGSKAKKTNTSVNRYLLEY